MNKIIIVSNIQDKIPPREKMRGGEEKGSEGVDRERQKSTHRREKINMKKGYEK